MSSGNQADLILKIQPAENAPYLTKNGIMAFSMTLACLAAGIISWSLKFEDAANLLVAAAAASFFFIAADHAAAILAWRAFKKKHISPEITIDQQMLSENKAFQLRLTMHNPLTIPYYLKAIRWTHSDNIHIQNNPDQVIEIPSKSSTEFTYGARTAQIGRGYIQGIGFLLISPIRCFHAEAHIQLQQKIQVVPAACASKKSSYIPDSMMGKMISRVRTIESDAELESVRPYQNSDPSRHISWRYYAKTRDLQVWQFSKNQEKTLLCLLDAGPQMRIFKPNNTSNLSSALNLIACCAGAFTAVTIIAYDENSAVYAAKNVPPNRLHAVMNQWILDELEWRPPSLQNKDQALIWNLAASQLHHDFLLYKHVDFSSVTKNGVKVNMKSLVEWAKSDDALNAHKSNDPERALEIMKIPYREMLTTLIRQRCCMPQTRLMPNPPEPKLLPACTLLEKQTKSAEFNMIWISDFASETSDTGLHKLHHIIRKRHIPVLGVCMPMPVHALNFIEKQGIRQREKIMHRFGKDIEFIDEK